MPWIKKIYSGPSDSFLDELLRDITAYVTDASIHGGDAWELIRSEPWPKGTVLKVPNRLEGEYGYMCLMANKPRVGSSYQSWFYSGDVFRKTFVYGSGGLRLKPSTDISVSGGRVLIFASGKCIHDYYFSPVPEIFAANANVLFFSMFKQYEPQFDWTELMGNERKTIKLKQLKYWDAIHPTTAPVGYVDPPLYPGVGAPAIGYSPSFFSAAADNTADEKDRPRVVYICKDRHRLTVAINCQEHWDAASTGFFEPFDTMGEYAFPVFTLGGTSGILPLTELFWYGGSPRVEHGFRLDFTEKNWSLSRGHPTHASTWWDGSQSFLDNYMYSNVQAMLPDGYWQSFASYGLRQDVYYNRQRSQYFSAHKEPERISPKYYLMPGQCNLGGLENPMPCATSLVPYYSGKIDVRNHKYYGLLPLYFVANKVDNYNQNLLGCIKNFYHCTQPVARYGEHVIDGKTYLIIPNAWENRKYHIKNYFSVLLGEAQNDARQLSETERIEKLSRNMNCAILLD